MNVCNTCMQIKTFAALSSNISVIHKWVTEGCAVSWHYLLNIWHTFVPIIIKRTHSITESAIETEVSKVQHSSNSTDLFNALIRQVIEVMNEPARFTFSTLSNWIVFRNFKEHKACSTDVNIQHSLVAWYLVLQPSSGPNLAINELRNLREEQKCASLFFVEN